ncbi:MAG: hypothetical protein RLZZ355_1158, partial [Pseudomonadota bacterium]
MLMGRNYPIALRFVQGKGLVMPVPGKMAGFGRAGQGHLGATA